MDRGPGRRPLSFVQVERFVRDLGRLGLGDRDVIALEEALGARPAAAPVIPDTGGVRKMRFAPPSWRTGKSGATRVAYFYMTAAGTVFLLRMYAKSDQGDLSSAERVELKRAVGMIERERGL